MPKDYDRNPARDKNGLTKQEAIFAENVIEHGQAKAGEIAYPDATPRSQAVIASKNMKKPAVVNSISKIATKIGLTRTKCAEAVKNGLDATRLYGKESVEHPDHSARLKAAELGLKIHGELKDAAPNQVNIFTKDAIEAFVAAFKRRPEDNVNNP